MALTDTLLDLCAVPSSEIPEQSLRLARLSLFDCLACGRAGIDEPLSILLRDMANEEGGKDVASVFGGGRHPARMAALVNGATSHALDYDDTHFAHIGHLSVAIYPAAVALGEENEVAGHKIVEAFLIGAEAAIRVGVALGAGHYNRGFHQTATAGAFGATIAAARLLGLSRDQTRAAIGLCATRASGLKSQFGTMGKPYNAGIAASNGIECAKLAHKGFTSCADGLSGEQGFIPTHSDTPQKEIAPTGQYLFNDVKYKFHACCHGTHAMIEGLLEALGKAPIAPDRVARIVLRTNPRWLRVCNIPTPATGLEVKFSYGWLAAMVLNELPTNADTIYTDQLAADPTLASLAKRVVVVADENLSDMQAAGEIELCDGEKIAFDHDLADPTPPDIIRTKLVAKAEALLGSEASALTAILDRFQDVSAREIGRLIRDGR